MITNRRIGGGKANAWGRKFELIFERECIFHGMAVTRIPDGCRVVGNNKLIRIKSPFDWICTYAGNSYLVDTKTVASGSFTKSKINESQVNEMIKHSIRGVITGYVIWYRDKNVITFIHAENLARMITSKIKYLGDPIGACGDFDLRKITRYVQQT